MNTPTPRTDAAVKLTFAAGHNTVCPNFARELERELTTITAERDQLRSETAQAQDRNVSHRLERDKAEAERTDAIYQRACEVEHELRAEVKRLKRAYEYDHKCLYEVRDRCHLWKQRAERAEAELATERARLDWIETPSGMDWQWEPERLTVSRASIDAAMKEGEK